VAAAPRPHSACISYASGVVGNVLQSVIHTIGGKIAARAAPRGSTNGVVHAPQADRETSNEHNMRVEMRCAISSPVRVQDDAESWIRPPILLSLNTGTQSRHLVPVARRTSSHMDSHFDGSTCSLRKLLLGAKRPHSPDGLPCFILS
jgi:hypothetical protein